MESDSYKNKIIFNSAIFAIAMAYLEATVVVYLRELYYPHGFRFPMMQIPVRIALVEIGREVATIAMLWFIARLAARNAQQKIILFLFNFAVWDIFYYVWLKVLLNWPATWLDWDILFLIPAPWLAPWLAPALISLGLIITTLIVWYLPERFGPFIFSMKEWIAIFLSAGLILGSFFLQTKNTLRGGIPDYYPWWLFGLGYVSALIVFIRRFLKRSWFKEKIR